MANPSAHNDPGSLRVNNEQPQKRQVPRRRSLNCGAGSSSNGANLSGSTCALQAGATDQSLPGTKRCIPQSAHHTTADEQSPRPAKDRCARNDNAAGGLAESH
jgi:hypothetical protein